jgi:hypothetical protein
MAIKGHKEFKVVADKVGKVYKDHMVRAIKGHKDFKDGKDGKVSKDLAEFKVSKVVLAGKDYKASRVYEGKDHKVSKVLMVLADKVFKVDKDSKAVLALEAKLILLE